MVLCCIHHALSNACFISTIEHSNSAGNNRVGSRIFLGGGGTVQYICAMGGGEMSRRKLQDGRGEGGIRNSYSVTLGWQSISNSIYIWDYPELTPRRSHSVVSFPLLKLYAQYWGWGQCAWDPVPYIKNTMAHKVVPNHHRALDVVHSMCDTDGYSLKMLKEVHRSMVIQGYMYLTLGVSPPPPSSWPMPALLATFSTLSHTWCCMRSIRGCWIFFNISPLCGTISWFL